MPKLEPYEPSESERRLIDEMFTAFYALRRQGWQEAMYAPVGKDLWLIEMGSTGIHRGRREDDITFWVTDEVDTWPSNPVLFKLHGNHVLAKQQQEKKLSCTCRGFYQPVDCPVHDSKKRYEELESKGVFEGPPVLLEDCDPEDIGK